MHSFMELFSVMRASAFQDEGKKANKSFLWSIKFAISSLPVAVDAILHIWLRPLLLKIYLKRIQVLICINIVMQ